MDIQYSNSSLKYKQLGNQAYKAQDYNKAINFYTKAIQNDRNQPNYYTNRALCFYNLSQYEQCVKDCQKALKINPNLVKALKKKSQACINILRFDDAVAAIKMASQIQKNTSTNNELEEVQSLKSNYQRFKIAEQQNDYPQALSCIGYLVNKIPTNVAIKLNKVQCLAKTGNTSQASHLLNSIHNQHSSEFEYLKGIIDLYNGQNSKAKNHFANGLRFDPQNKKCQQALQKAKKCQQYKQEGNQLIKQQKWRQAEAKYTQALNLDPYNKKLNSIIYSNRALTFMKRGQKLNALQDLNKSLELDPNYLKSLIRRAQVNMERQDYSAALSDYSKVQQLDPKTNLKAKIDEAKKKEKQAKKKDYYAILGVPKNATEAEIKKAYKALALKYHPDRNRAKSQVQQEQSSKKFKDIAQAHGVLTDPEKKKKYDCGQMEYDGDQGSSGFENMNQHFTSGNMGQNMKFTFNGTDMNGMGVDSSQIFKMFFGGGKSDGFQGFGGFQGFTRMGRMGGMKNNPSSSKRGASQFKGFNFGQSQNGPQNFSNFNFN